MEFLSYFDLFKVQFLFYFQGKAKNSTGFGIALSFLIVIFLIYQFAISDFVLNKSPNVVTQSLATSYSKKIEFNEKTPFVIAFGDATTLTRFIDPTILQLVVLHTINNNSTIIKTHPCQYEDLKDSMNESYFKTLQFEKAFCLDQKKFNIEGYVDDSEYKFVQILVFPCNNFTSNGTCKTMEKIKSTVKNLIFSFFYRSIQIDANDYQNPLKEMTLPAFITLNPSLKKSNILYLKNGEVSTDNGWIFTGTNIKLESGMMFHTFVQEFDLRLEDSDPFAYFNIFASKQIVQCSRYYKKLPETLASLAGMANLFVIIGAIICNLISYVSSIRYTVNKLYYFEYADKKNKKRKKKEKEKSNENTIANPPTSNVQQKNIDFSVLPEKTPNDYMSLNKEKEKQLNDSSNQKSLLLEMSNLQINPLKPKTTYSFNQKILKEDSFILEKYSQELDENIEKNNVTMVKNEAKLADKIIEEKNEKNDIENNEKTTRNEQNKLIENPTNDKLDKNTLNNKKHEFESLISQVNIPKNYPLEIGVFEYLKCIVKKIFCMKLSEKEQLISQAEMIFKEEIDVSNILIKMHDIEKLKLLVLDPNQTVLFNYLTKPFVKLNKTQTKNIILRKGQEEIEPSKFMESYLKCTEFSKNNEISKKLVEFCDIKQAHLSKRHTRK